MLSGRTTAKALIVATVLASCAVAHVGAQTCTISSASPGPLFCAVATTMTATVHMSAIVRVSVTPVSTWNASVATMALGITANTAYALEIARSTDSRSPLDEQSSRITLQADSVVHRVVIMPTRRFDASESMGDHGRALVALSPGAQRAPNPMGVVLTIAAP